MSEEEKDEAQRVETALRRAGVKLDERERGGLVIVREQLTPEMSKQRREDNNFMRKRRTARKTTAGTKTWIGKAKAKHKAKRNEKS